MTSRYSSAISPRVSREFCLDIRPLISEGAGNAGRLMRPQSRVQMKKAHEHSHHGHTGITRHSPRNGFNGYFVLSPVTGLVCHRRLRKLPFANLTPASGRQDHTTSPSASGALVFGTISVHRIPPHVRDDRETPLGWGGMIRCIPVSTRPSSEIRKFRNGQSAVFPPWPGRAVRRTASLPLAYARPSTSFAPRDKEGVDARITRLRQGFAGSPVLVRRSRSEGGSPGMTIGCAAPYSTPASWGVN
jgi:hypothetical protein